MGNENNQGTQTQVADSQPVPTDAKLSVLGEALGFGKTTFEQPNVKPRTPELDLSDDKGHNPPSEQPQSDSGREDEPDSDAGDDIDGEQGAEGDDPDEDDPNNPEPSEHDPLALLFDSDTSYDLGDGETVTGDELKNRLMRQSDYTKKTQELATERTELETERKGYADSLMFFDYANQNAMAEFNNVNWQALQMHNPAQYQELLGGYQQLQMRQQQIDAAKQQFLNDYNARNTAAIEAKRVEAIDHIRAEVPDIEALIPELEMLAKNAGFTEQELPQMMADPRAIKLLVNSYRINAAGKKAKDLTKPNATPQPRPRAAPNKEAQNQTRKARLTKAANGGDQNAARALLADKLNSKKFDRFHGRKE